MTEDPPRGSGAFLRRSRAALASRHRMAVGAPVASFSSSGRGEVIDPEDGLVWRWEKDFEALGEPPGERHREKV